MTYFEARRALHALKEYRALAVQYWSARLPINRGQHAWMLGPNMPMWKDTLESAAIRQRLNLLQAEAILAARKVGALSQVVVSPPPMIGGAASTHSLMELVVDQDTGHASVPTDKILDAIDYAIGAAERLRKVLLLRLLMPWYWLIDVPAAVVRWPFSVMRKAGVPANIVDSAGSRVVQAVLSGAGTVLAAGWAAYKLRLLDLAGAAFGHLLGK